MRLCDTTQTELHDHLAPWLFRVCRNRALDVLRKDRRWEALEGDASDRVPARESDPALLAEQKDLGRWVFQLLNELSTTQREVLELWLNDFSYLEISQITEKSEGHIRVIAHRGLLRLREHPRTRELLAGISKQDSCLSR